MPVSDASTQRAGRVRGGELAIVACVLALMLALMADSVRQSSLTFDESPHAAGGAAIVQRRDFRLQAENGVLPQWLAGLALAKFPLPPVERDAWRQGDGWGVGYEWFYQLGYDGRAMAWRARMACAVFALALGLVVWGWSRGLFGRTGGLLSLVLYALSPTMLANGPLITSDVAAALFLTTSLGLIWAVTERVCWGRVALCGLSVGLLFLSKMSALLIVPFGAVLIGLSLGSATPLWVGGKSRPREVKSVVGRLGWLMAAAAVVAGLAMAIVWTGYDFRFAATAGGGSDELNFPLPWEHVLEQPAPGVVLHEAKLRADQASATVAVFRRHGAALDIWSDEGVAAFAEVKRDLLEAPQRAAVEAVLARPPGRASLRVLEFLRRHEWMPEAWIYGVAHVLRQSQQRAAFLNGEVRAGGWRAFFPYAFAVKTPLPVFAIVALAIGAVVVGGDARSIGRGLLRTAPLWLLAAGYAAIAIGSSMNIGHRHLLPVYPAMFVLCGGAARWATRRAGAIALGVIGALLAAETAWRHPHYLAYFNGLVSPRQAYRHLVDSSLDWGQDLPAVQRYLAAQPSSEPVYLSYFGTASPAYHGVAARPLYSFFGLHLRETPDFTRTRLPAETAAAQLAAFRRDAPEYEVMRGVRSGNQVLVEILKRPAALRWSAGTFLIGATMLEAVHFDGVDGPRGRWSERHERVYQELRAAVQPLLSDDAGVRTEGYRARTNEDWADILRSFEEYRFARLAAFLRAREPDDQIAFTVLVYRLNAADVARVSDGPPPAER